MIIKTTKKKLSKNTKWHSLWLRQPGDLGHARLKSEHEMWPSLPPGSGDQEIRGRHNIYLLRELLTPPPVQGLLTAVAAVRCVPFPSETLKKKFKKQDKVFSAPLVLQKDARIIMK